MDAGVQPLLAEVNDLSKELGSNLDDVVTRKQLRIAASNLSRALEEPGDIVERICYSVCDKTQLIPPASNEFLILVFSSWKKFLFGSPSIWISSTSLLRATIRNLSPSWLKRQALIQCFLVYILCYHHSLPFHHGRKTDLMLVSSSFTPLAWVCRGSGGGWRDWK